MANTTNKKPTKTEAKNEKPLVYHKDHLTDEIRKTKGGYTYTEDWNQVTAPEHLAIRKKQYADLKKAENVAEAETETQAETTAE